MRYESLYAMVSCARYAYTPDVANGSGDGFAARRSFICFSAFDMSASVTLMGVAPCDWMYSSYAFAMSGVFLAETQGRDFLCQV